jgi:hypothetical protein
VINYLHKMNSMEFMNGRDSFETLRIASNTLDKQSRTADRGGPLALWLGVGLTTPYCKRNLTRYELLHSVSDLPGSCEHGTEPQGSIKGGEFLE